MYREKIIPELENLLKLKEKDREKYFSLLRSKIFSEIENKSKDIVSFFFIFNNSDFVLYAFNHEDKSFYLYDKYKNKFESYLDDELLMNLLFKKSIVYVNGEGANIAIPITARQGKDDFAVFSIAEGVISKFENLFNFSYKERLDEYKKNKLKAFSYDDFIKNKIDNKSKNPISVDGDVNLLKDLIKEKFESALNRNSKRINDYFSFLENMFFDENFFMSELINEMSKLPKEKRILVAAKFLFDQGILKPNKSNPKSNPIKKLKKVECCFFHEDISIEENLFDFNNLYFKIVKELKVLEKDRKIMYRSKFFGDKLVDKPLVSKILPVFIPEDSVFDYFFILKYYLNDKKDKTDKIKKILESEDNDGIIVQPYYNFLYYKSAIKDYDVLPSVNNEVDPPLHIFDVSVMLRYSSEEDKRNSFYKKVKIKQKSKYNNFVKKEYKNFYGFVKDIKGGSIVKLPETLIQILDLKDILEMYFSSKKEVQYELKIILNRIVSAKNNIYINYLKNVQEKPIKDIYKQKLLDAVSFVLSVENYLKKGDLMNKDNIIKSKVYNLRDELFEALKTLYKEDKKLEINDIETLSYIGGNTIKFLIEKRKGNSNVGLLIPVFESVKKIKDLKTEIDKAFVSYAYDESINQRNALLKLIAYLKGVDNNIKVDKDFFLMGLLDSTTTFFEFFKYINELKKENKTEKGDNNE